MMLLPNAPISEPGYKEQYGVKTIAAQPRFSHRSNPTILVNDLVSFVVETNKCSHEDWVKGHQFRWLVIFGHYLGPLQFIARALNKIYNISFKDFYSDLLQFSEDSSKTFIGNEYLTIKKNLSKILKNERHWGDVIDGAGDINWEVDEATCIRLVSNKDRFYSEISDYLNEKYELDEKILIDIIKYQQIRILDPYKNYPVSEKFDYNIHDVIESDKPINKEKNEQIFEAKNYNKDLFTWAKEILWFGRRLAKYKTEVKEVKKVKNTLVKSNEKSFFNRI